MKTDYLRISLTDKCNLRCLYCHPLSGSELLSRDQILTLEEIHRIVELFSQLGIHKVRLTGGEPLLRRNITYLISRLAQIKAIEQLALTTNGLLLEQTAQQLKDAGLQRVNVSLDSAERKNYQQITGTDLLEKVIRGIHKTLHIGLTPVKINSVIIKNLNCSQILPLAKMCLNLPIAVRFIEYCPTSRYTKPQSDYVPTAAVQKIIEDKFGCLTPVVSADSNGPASYFQIKNAAGTIGFISGRSSLFCQSCNRIRLTSDGKIKPCLYSSKSYDIKNLIRTNAPDKQILTAIKKILNSKSNHTKLTSPEPEFSMQKIGG